MLTDSLTCCRKRITPASVTYLNWSLDASGLISSQPGLEMTFGEELL